MHTYRHIYRRKTYSQFTSLAKVDYVRIAVSYEVSMKGARTDWAQENSFVNPPIRLLPKFCVVGQASLAGLRGKGFTAKFFALLAPQWELRLAVRTLAHWR